MKKTVWNYGLLSGALGMVWLIVFKNFEQKIGFELGEVLGYVSIILSFSVIFFAIRSYRDQQLNGFISFGKAFKTGLFISLISSAIYGLAWAIMSHFFYPDFYNHYLEFKTAQMQAQGLSAAEIAAYSREMMQMKEMMSNPLVNFLVISVIEPLPVGIIVTLICSGILKKNPATSNI